MDRCVACGAALASAAGWCGQCFTPAGGGPAHVGSLPATAGAMRTAASGLATSGPPLLRPGAHAVGLLGAAPSALPETPPRRTRWGKTPTTFGPLGRILATLGVAIPLVLMSVGAIVDPLALGGVGIWLVVIMPWALRDIWKAGIPVG